jgi:hypothetical protein
MSIAVRRMVCLTLGRSLHLRGGGGILRGGGGHKFGRARTTGFGSPFLLFIFRIAEHMVSPFTISAGQG